MRVDRFDAGRQPAGRAPAPGRLALVQAFLNTFWDLDAHGTERWADAAAYGHWLAERSFGGGPVVREDLARAIDTREALHALALANHDDAPAREAEAVLDRIAAEIAPGAGRTPRFGGDDRLDVAANGPDAALALVLGVVFAARADGTWRRLEGWPPSHRRCAVFDRP